MPQYLMHAKVITSHITKECIFTSHSLESNHFNFTEKIQLKIQGISFKWGEEKKLVLKTLKYIRIKKKTLLA